MKENFAIKLRELRKASGMTQEQLAAEFGVSVQAVSKWETAASYPDIELMPRIADLFGVSLDELLRDVKNEKNIDAGEEIQTDAEQQCDAACNPESVEVEYEDENDDENDGDDEEDDDDENDDDDEEDDDGSCIFVKKGRNGIVSVNTDAIEEFGRKIEKMAKKKAEKAGCAFEKSAKKHSRSSTRNYGNRFEWSNIMIDEMPDDNTLRVVLMRGKQIVSSQEYDPAVCIPVELKYEKENGIAGMFGRKGGRTDCSINVEIWGNADINGSVNGDVYAGGNVNCGEIGGDVGAGGNVNCGDIGGDISAGGSIECGSIGGDVNAGGNVSCADVGGDVETGGSVECGKVSGDEIIIKDEHGERHRYHLTKFARTNQSNCANQRPVVSAGQRICKDDLLADGANYTVGTQNATTGYIYAMSDIEDAGKGTVAAFPNGNEAVMALVNGTESIA